MFKNLFKLNNHIKKLHDLVEYDLKPYEKILNEINELHLTHSVTIG